MQNKMVSLRFGIFYFKTWFTIILDVFKSIYLFKIRYIFKIKYLFYQNMVYNNRFKEYILIYSK